MGKCIGYTAGAITFMAIGALATGLALYFTYPEARRSVQTLTYSDEEMRFATCELVAAPNFTVKGTIYFRQNVSYDTTVITGTVEGLTVGEHGFHIHEFGANGGRCKDAGKHYNPDGQPHGGQDSDQRHVGDLGNIRSVEQGASTLARVQIEDALVTLYGDRAVLGRAVVVHAGRDDLGFS
ncbi:superoxide dismutase [Cu-Zn], partial [Hyalella azteca]|uniref:Superoxide dismutase [Cu-Zn] n=1 Tax=Hyalella azteca TaxID=294128 RepID=A0A8B7NDY7_HYAAZ